MSAGEQRGRGRTLAEPAYPHDDGAPDPALRQAIADNAPDLPVRLRTCRLLVAVVAVLDELDEHGGDKDSHMAVVSMVNAAGDRGLLAFTGLDSLHAWDPTARPVPVPCSMAAQAALEDDATALVIDVCGPVRHVVQGAELVGLASSQ